MIKAENYETEKKKIDNETKSKFIDSIYKIDNSLAKLIHKSRKIALRL